MKKLSYILTLALIAGSTLVHAGEKKPGEKTVQTPKTPGEVVDTQQVAPEATGSDVRTMKIGTDSKTEESRRKEFLEELRKLYKANFL